jgi:hypothetical protein
MPDEPEREVGMCHAVDEKVPRMPRVGAFPGECRDTLVYRHRSQSKILCQRLGCG